MNPPKTNGGTLGGAGARALGSNDNEESLLTEDELVDAELEERAEEEEEVSKLYDDDEDKLEEEMELFALLLLAVELLEPVLPLPLPLLTLFESLLLFVLLVAPYVVLESTPYIKTLNSFEWPCKSTNIRICLFFSLSFSFSFSLKFAVLF